MSPILKGTGCSIGILAVLWLPAAPCIEFEEVGEASGISGKGPTFGASWGDFDGDGHADVWVGNHFEKPSLYLNQGDGTFRNIIDEVWNGRETADAHGAAWADFDNDGDQDLVELVGAQFGVGEEPSHLFSNDGGRLVERAGQLGLQQPLARGRTPLWLDADRDGRLDLIYMNSPRLDGQGRSALFLQTDAGFVDASARLGFKDPQRSRLDKLADMLTAARHLRFGVPPIIYGHASFAQLAELSGDDQLDLLTLGPLRIYDLSGPRFRDLTYSYTFDRITGVRDAAVADFDNDGDMDIYLVRSGARSEAAVVDGRTLHVALLGQSRSDTVDTVVFEGGERLEFSIGPWNLDPGQILIGGERRPAETLSFTLTAAEARPAKSAGWGEPEAGKLVIEYGAESGRWRIAGSRLRAFLKIESERALNLTERPGDSGKSAGMQDILLLRDGRRLVPTVPYIASDASTQCHSVVAGDFDNDGDSDVYLVCTGSAVNVENVLLENTGSAEFKVVAGAGGAEGTLLGRGDVAVSADYDNDGYLDLLIANGAGERLLVDQGPHQLFRNKGGENNWLELDLQGVKSNRDGIGARVTVVAAGASQTRDQGGGMHHLGQDFDRLHFGLGQATVVEEVRVHWPAGGVQTLDNVSVNQVLIVTEE